MTFSPGQADALMDVAIRSIQHGLTHQCALTVDIDSHESPLTETRSSFVTLHLHGQLRGCMGGLIARAPLICDVAEHAFMAAFKDPRFPGVTDKEFTRLDVHLSVLSPNTSMQFADEAHQTCNLPPQCVGNTTQRERFRTPAQGKGGNFP